MIKEFQGEYRWLSNFTQVKIVLEGIEYSSVEHAYMSAKSENEYWKKFCSDSKNTPGQVKKESKKLRLPDDWETKRLEVMSECIKQKYSQEPFRTKLLETGDQFIQEGNNWNDKFFGICLKTGEGKNHLGKLIMNVRDILNKNEK